MEEGNADVVAQVDAALKSFACYLYVGASHPSYKARPWNDDDHYLNGERMRNLEILAGYKKTELVPIDKIKLAMDSGLIRRPETLMFALAMCARQKKSEKLRAAAYYFLAEHCKEWAYFILFIKYASFLCKIEGSKDKDADKNNAKKPIGWGRGWKNAVNKWYFTKDPVDLVSLVTRHKGNHGWTHKDIFKLSHPETSGLEVEKQAILCYVMKGLEAAEKEYDDEPEAMKVLTSIRSIEEFKRCQCKDQIVKAINFQKYSIDYVHPTGLKHKEVWLALLSTMDVRTILNNLPKLTRRGLLTKLGPAIPMIVRSLTDKANLKWNSILPAEILLIFNTYKSPLCTFSYITRTGEVAYRTTTGVTASKPKGAYSTVVDNIRTKNKPVSGKSNKRLVKTKELDVRIHDALCTTLSISQTVDITRSSKRRYLVSIKIPGRRPKNCCAELGLALALPLLHRSDLPEDAVTIIGFEPRWSGKIGRGQPLPINKGTSFSDAIKLLDNLRRCDAMATAMEHSPLEWALHSKKPYDVFINVTNEQPTEKDFTTMELYKKFMNLPDARFVDVVLQKFPFKAKETLSKDSLIINGFNSDVPWIIEAYARGLF